MGSHKGGTLPSRIHHEKSRRSALTISWSTSRFCKSPAANGTLLIGLIHYSLHEKSAVRQVAIQRDDLPRQKKERIVLISRAKFPRRMTLNYYWLVIILRDSNLKLYITRYIYIADSFYWSLEMTSNYELRTSRLIIGKLNMLWSASNV